MNSEYPQPHKQAMRIARDGLRKRLDDRQIKLVQEALRRGALEGTKNNFTHVLGRENSTEHDINEIRIELFKTLAEFAGKGVYLNSDSNREEIATTINQRIGAMIYNELPLRELAIPSKKSLRALQLDERYDFQSIQVLSQNLKFRTAYNGLVMYQTKTVTDMQNSIAGTISNLFCRMAFKPRLEQ